MYVAVLQSGGGVGKSVRNATVHLGLISTSWQSVTVADSLQRRSINKFGG